MKTLFLLCLLGVTLISAQPAQPGHVGNYVEENASNAEKNPWLKSIVEFGEKAFLEKAFAEGKISSQSLTAVKVLKMATQVVAGFNHKFTVEFKDAADKAIYATLIVFTQPWTHKQELTSYSISDTPPQ